MSDSHDAKPRNQPVAGFSNKNRLRFLLLSLLFTALLMSCGTVRQQNDPLNAAFNLDEEKITMDEIS